MGPFASRLVGIRAFNGLVVPVAELWGIVRTAYLSPSFPFLLCFELWQYLRQQQPKGDHRGPGRQSRRPRRKETSSSAGFPSTLRLLRGAAFAATLMAPAEGWAQVRGAPGASPLPAAPVPQQGSASGIEGQRPALSPNDSQARRDFRGCVEARRAPAHSRGGAKLQHGRELCRCAESFSTTEVPPYV